MESEFLNCFGQVEFSTPADPLLSLGIGLFALGLLAVLTWPRRGLIARFFIARHHTRRVCCEDALKHIEKTILDGRRPTLQSLSGALQISLNEVSCVVEELARRKFIRFDESELRLTKEGHEYALHIIRAHRLWEHYLSERTGVTESEWHSRAEVQEHCLSPGDANVLATQLGNPIRDPHGDPIPTSEGVIPPVKGKPLASIPVGEIVRIVHIEDEPESVYSRIVTEGLSPGMNVRLEEVKEELVRFQAGGKEHVLAPIFAANITVAPLGREQNTERESDGRLSTLLPGETATVSQISPRCRGAERRRLISLGILPGTSVTAETVSPGGDPTAYRIRGALIALRKEQTCLIHTTRKLEVAAA